MAGGKAEQRQEGGVAGSTSVKAEHELVEVGLQMGTAQAVVDAQGPDFEVGEDAVDPGQDDMGGDLADDMRIVSDAGGPWVSRPSVGLGGRPRCEIAGNEGMQTLGRIVGHLGKTDAAGTVILDLDRPDDEDLALVTASAATGQRIMLLRQAISVSSTSIRPASGLRLGATMLWRSLAQISQADL